ESAAGKNWCCERLKIMVTHEVCEDTFTLLTRVKLIAFRKNHFRTSVCCHGKESAQSRRFDSGDITRFFEQVLVELFRLRRRIARSPGRKPHGQTMIGTESMVSGEGFLHTVIQLSR